ncbi:MAG: hypothetical protein L6R35_001980 [Caloplaca aegaea]|nr:MAG: hypothetical protein L6R35_001980 [Caloplaca aegaea]
MAARLRKAKTSTQRSSNLQDGTSASPAPPASLGTNLRIWRTFSVALAISTLLVRNIDKISELERQTLRALSAEVILCARSEFHEQMQTTDDPPMTNVSVEVYPAASVASVAMNASGHTVFTSPKAYWMARPAVS